MNENRDEIIAGLNRMLHTPEKPSELAFISLIERAAALALHERRDLRFRKLEMQCILHDSLKSLGATK